MAARDGAVRRHLLPAVCLALAVLLTAALSGCGNGGGGARHVPADTVVLALKTDNTSPTARRAQLACIDRFIEAFGRAEPDIGVRVTYYSELPKDTAGIDVMLLGADDMLLYADGGLTDAGAYLKYAGLTAAELAGGAVNAASFYDGKTLRMLPFNYDHAVLLADQKLLEAAGVTVPENGFTLDEFETALEQLTYRTEGTAYSGVYMPYYLVHVWQYYCRLLAGTYLDGGRFAFRDNTAVYDAISRMYSMYTHNTAYTPKLGMPGRICAMSWTFACEPGRNSFPVETAAEEALNPGKRTDELLASGELVLLPLPAGSDGRRVGIADTDFIKGFAVPVTSQKQELAGKLAAFALTAEGQRLLIPYYGGIPANRQLWAEEFWRTGVFAGGNAERALIGVDNGLRDDFTEALAGDPDVYNKNIRMRTVFSAVMVRELAGKKSFERFIKQLEIFELDANKVLDGKVKSYFR